MKIIFLIFLITFLIFNTAYSEENQQDKNVPPIGDRRAFLTPSEGSSDEPVMSPSASSGLTKDDENHPSPLPSPLRGEGQSLPPKYLSGGEGITRESSDENQTMPEDEEMLYTPAIQMEEPGEELFTPAKAEAILYCPVREPEKPRRKFYAAMTTSWQTIDLDTNSSKAREYRTLTDGFYIKDLSLNYEDGNQEFRTEFGNIAPLFNTLSDGYGDLRYVRAGIIDASLGLFKFPHSYGNDAESIFNPVNPYTFRLPSSVAATPFDTASQRDKYDLRIKFTPGDKIIITSSFIIENREGRRPLTLESLTTSSAVPAAIIEIAEPTDYTTASIDLGLEYIDRNLDLQLNNNMQIFTNARLDEIIWDNPWQSGAYGLAKTADDYTVHTLSFKPSIKFSDRIRLINTLSFSKVTASINLVPFTTVDGVGEEFQKDVLDPDVRSLNVSSILAAMPHHDVSLNIKYRYNAYENDTPGIEETPAYVMLDGSSTKYTRTPRYTSVITSALSIDGKWSVADEFTVDAGIENRDTPRREREVEKENVRSIYFTVNSTLSDMLSGLIGYRYERKRGEYDPSYYKAVYDTGSSVDQHPLLRAYDLSGSDAHTLKAGMDFIPLDALSLSASMSLTQGEYIDVIIGRRSSNSESLAVSAEYTPFKNFLIYSQYFYDIMTIESSYSWTYDSTITASYNSPETNPLYSTFIKPVSETLEDTSDSYVIGFDYDMTKLISVAGSLSRNTSTGTSIYMPVVSSTTDTFELKMSRKIPSLLRLKNLRVSAGYYSERYERNDYALDNFPDTVETIDANAPEDIFLGIREPDYKLNIFSLSLDFSF